MFLIAPKALVVIRKSSLYLDDTFVLKLQQYAHRCQLTINTLMQGVWSYLLYRYTGEGHVVFGVTVSGRPEELPNVERRVGMYINTLPFHTELKEDSLVSSWLQQLQLDQVSSRQYQYSRLNQIQQWVGVQGDLFDSLFVFENYPVSKETFSNDWGLQISQARMHEQTNYPLGISVVGQEQMWVRFGYNTRLLDNYYVKQMSVHFREVLIQIAEGAASQRIGDLSMLSSSELELLTEGFNSTTVGYDRTQTVVDLFELQVARSADAIALVYGDDSLSYGELNRRSNQVAHYLHSRGVKEESLVAICIDRSLEMVIGILGILKAGGAYVPIDPEYPSERISYMLEDTNASVILSGVSSVGSIPSLYADRIFLLDSGSEELSCLPSDKLRVQIEPHHLVYIIYTSGSTGKPKGVMIEHRNVIGMLSGFEHVAPNHSNGVGLSVCPYVFDVSVWEFFVNICFGNSLHIVEKKYTLDPEALSWYIVEKGVSTAYIPPTILADVIRYLEFSEVTINLQRLLVGVLPIKQGVLQRFCDLISGIKIINGYGPTEATICASFYDFKRAYSVSDNTPIGKPIGNYSIYILDSDLHPVPVGVGGELYIGGAGVGRGYLNLSALTSEKFIVDPFGSSDRLYRSGDLGRWLADGNLEYLGRIDDQVKIRGYRIELGEIQSVVQQSGYVNQSVVIAREDIQGSRRLIGYVVSNGSFHRDDLVRYLQKHLPDYMVPQLWVELESIPLTRNGKVDKGALPHVDASELQPGEYVAPRNAVEQMLCKIWGEVLGVDRVGVHDNFFALGGDSLLTTRTASLIRKKMKVEVQIRDLFEYPSVSLFGVLLDRVNKKSEVPALLIHKRPDQIPLSFSQERLWFIHQFEGSAHYHIPWLLRIEGEVDMKALHLSFQELVNRHEVLRSVLQEEDGVSYQQILGKDLWEMNYIDGKMKSQSELDALLADLVEAPFDLSMDHMLRVHVIGVLSGDHLLLINLHHVAADAWSWNILIRELTILYGGFCAGNSPSLPALSVQYADYSLWQRNYLQGEVLEEKLKYWQSQLSGLPVLELPTDYVRPSIQSRRGGYVSGNFGVVLLNDLRSLSRSMEVTQFMLCLSVFKVLLHRYSGQEDISVGSPIAGRTHYETEGLIGFFVNTLVLRSELNGRQSFRAFVEEIKQMTLASYEHQDVPFEKIVEKVVTERDLSRHPLFQVMFVMQILQEGDGSQLVLGDAKLTMEDIGTGRSKFDLMFSVRETIKGLEVSVEYSKDLYEESTIRRMLDHYERLFQSVVSNPDSGIGDLSMLSSSELELLTEGFNSTTVG